MSKPRVRVFSHRKNRMFFCELCAYGLVAAVAGMRQIAGTAKCQVAVRKLIMEERKSRTESLIEWARNNYERHISIRVARKYLKDDGYFWAALSDARANHHLRFKKYSA